MQTHQNKMKKQNRNYLTNLLVKFFASKKCLNCNAINLEANLLCYNCWNGLNFNQAQGHYNDIHYIFELANKGEELIYKNKYGKDNYLNNIFFKFLFSELASSISNYSLITYVPYYHGKLRKKIFSNNAILANKIADNSHLNVLHDILLKKYAIDQVGLNYIERQKNAKKIFALNNSKVKLVSGKNVILLDDVITTSATINICQDLLYKAGAKKVFCLALAKRVSKHMDENKTINLPKL